MSPMFLCVCNLGYNNIFLYHFKVINLNKTYVIQKNIKKITFFFIFLFFKYVNFEIIF